MNFVEPKRLTYDASSGDEIEAGDVLRTATGKCHRVVSARKMKSRYPNRWSLVTIKIDHAETGDTIHALRWYPRSKAKP